MNKKLLFSALTLLVIIHFYKDIVAQNTFSYKRQLSYNLCEKCMCKSGRSFSIISPNLDAEKKECAEIYNRQDIYLAELGISGSKKQDHCWSQCSHKWKEVFEKEQSLSIPMCKTRAARDKFAAEKQKKQDDYVVEVVEQFNLSYNALQEKRSKASIFLRSNDIQNYLLLQEEICKTWKGLDSVYRRINEGDFILYRDWIKQNVMYNPYDYYSDVNNFAWHSLLSKEYDKAYKYLNVLIRNSNVFVKILTDADIEKKSGSIEFTLAANYSHSVLLANNDTKFLWYSHGQVRLLPDVNKQRKWSEKMVVDYIEFENKGILKNVDTLKFIVRAWTKTLSVKASPSSSNKVKSFVEKQYSLTSGLREFFGEVDESFQIKGRSNFYGVIQKIYRLDANLFKVNYPQIFNGSWANYISIYFYLDKFGGVKIVNLSSVSLSSKKMEKIISASLEIRDKDIPLINK
jgi:hypothetical protein